MIEVMDLVMRFLASAAGAFVAVWWLVVRPRRKECLNQRVQVVMARTQFTGPDCGLCAPGMAWWWAENGFTEAERNDWCQTNCPPVQQ